MKSLSDSRAAFVAESRTRREELVAELQEIENTLAALREDASVAPPDSTPAPAKVAPALRRKRRRRRYEPRPDTLLAKIVETVTALPGQRVPDIATLVGVGQGHAAASLAGLIKRRVLRREGEHGGYTYFPVGE